jgi:hypothetical protein
MLSVASPYKEPLEVYGPTGTQKIADLLLKAPEVDIKDSTEAVSEVARHAG